MRVNAKVGKEAVNHQVNIFLLIRHAATEWLLNFEQQVLHVVDNRLHEVEDDIVAVEDIDVGGRLAQLDAGDGTRFNHQLVGRAMTLERLLDGVDKMLLLQMPWTAGSAGVGIVDLLQHLRCEDEQHHLQGPDGVPVLVLRLRKCVQKVEECLAALGQLLVGVLLQIGELVRICVHPVPDRFLEGNHQHKMGIFLQLSKLGNSLGKQLGQSANVHIDVLKVNNFPMCFYNISISPVSAQCPCGPTVLQRIQRVLGGGRRFEKRQQRSCSVKEQTKPKIAHLQSGSLCCYQLSPLRRGFSIARDHCLCSLGLVLCRGTGRSREAEA